MSELSNKIIRELNKSEKKKFAIFFTPINIIKQFVKEIDFSNISTILEPSCGSCEFINYITSTYDNVQIDGIEFNKYIYDSIVSDIGNSPNIFLINADFLKYDTNTVKKYDLIIGNPPYFIMNKSDVDKKFSTLNLYDGKTNIFILFIIHALTKLNNNGVLAFVLPKSFMNSINYSKLRYKIHNEYCVEKIIDFGNIKFDETSQETIGLIVRKSQTHNSNDTYVFNVFENMPILTFNKHKLEEYYAGAVSLLSLGFKVKTGTIVWNERKKDMSNDPTDTLLIHNSNIEKNSLVIKNFKNDEKKQYIKSDGKSEELPIIVVNRGNGNSKYKLQFCYIDNGTILIENHLNVISPMSTCTTDMSKIINSLNNPKTAEWCSLFLGNNAFSKTEIENYLPIYLE
jgi:adenine-specific DNA-methyltransferase